MPKDSVEFAFMFEQVRGKRRDIPFWARAGRPHALTCPARPQPAWGQCVRVFLAQLRPDARWSCACSCECLCRQHFSLQEKRRDTIRCKTRGMTSVGSVQGRNLDLKKWGGVTVGWSGKAALKQGPDGVQQVVQRPGARQHLDHEAVAHLVSGP